MNRSIAAVALTGLLIFSSFSAMKQDFDLKASMARGQEIYVMHCLSCHQEKGEGIDEVFPPLAASDYLMADKVRSIDQILHGVSGVIVVNGKTYNGDMPGYALSNEEVSDVLNYIRNSWGNKGEPVTPDEVAKTRKE